MLARSGRAPDESVQRQSVLVPSMGPDIIEVPARRSSRATTLRCPTAALRAANKAAMMARSGRPPEACTSTARAARSRGPDHVLETRGKLGCLPRAQTPGGAKSGTDRYLARGEQGDQAGSSKSASGRHARSCPPRPGRGPSNMRTAHVGARHRPPAAHQTSRQRRLPGSNQRPHERLQPTIQDP
jgi:hypothetical protein